ncbi:transmembrane protein, putative (macronuclear) [Tetrahymena thermophila SB210]|uniref:Transmembrane protein, putative n=1 Tax=Tetrahymena thermophila (strain SB210) TaxID=312017 RepID=Q23RW3_TETTS|nr:transmembrane protein, putative [Tetrahymena thermophila SB210]EAR99276.2 transmembrane protein, putative [Tetrahymena thermophila SB210]|eukprot:XP_001019521.2 transmembrane protein, putative [Tetrahymena thermophila SB210]
MTKSFQELFRMQQEYTKHQDWTNLFFVKVLIHRSSKFHNKFLANSTIENQQIRMHDPITFDFLMVEFQNSLKTQIQKQIEYFKYLCSDYFNLEELMIISKINLNGIENIRTILRELYDIHPKDQALYNLSQVFQLTLDFYSISAKKLRQMSSKKSYKHFFLTQVDVFSPNSCSVYCSLIGKNIEVKRTSSNFQQIFEIEQINVLGKQVSNLLPKLLFQMHEMTMDDFINLGIVESINIGQRFAFAQNGDGFVFPISIRIKIENFLDDFGVTALITKVKDSKQYIFFDEAFQISDISSYIYQKIFQSEYTLNQLRSQNIFSFMPLLQALLNDKTLSEVNYYNSCLLLKRRSGTRFEIKSFNDRKLSIASNESIFSVIFRFKSLQSKHMKHIKYLEIEKFQEVKSFQGRKQQLNLLSKCLNMELQVQENSLKENQEFNQESQVNISVQEINQNHNQVKVENALNNYDQLISIKIDEDCLSQFNAYNQQSNTNIIAVKNNDEEIIDIKREISSDHFLKEQQNYTPANGMNLKDQQNELISPKYEASSYQQLFNQSNNRLFSPQSFLNLTTINSPISPSLEKSFEQQNFKGKNIQRSSQQLLQKQVLIRQSIHNYQENSQNQENFSIKHAICDINQIFLDKWSDSPSSINLNNRGQINKNFENIKEEEDEFSFENEKYIQKQLQSEESSNSSISGQKKDNQLNEEQQSAFTGSQGSQISSKKILIRKITSNTNTGITNIIVFTGLASIIFLYISVITFYLININNLNSITNLFRKFNIATIINQGVFQFAKEQVFLTDAIIFQNILGLNKTLTNPFNSSETITQLTYIQNISQTYQQAFTRLFSNNIDEILQSQNEEFFQYISETEISTFSDYYDNTIYTHEFRNNTILYTMLWFQSCLNQLYLQGAHSEYYPQSVVFGNIEVFNSAILQIQVMISNQLVSLYQQLKETQLDQLVQTLCSALFLVVIAVPFMIYFKSQQYKTIKLLGSFPPQLLEQYINLFSFYLKKIDQYQKKQIDHITQYQSFNMIQSMKSISMKQLSGVFDNQKVKQGKKDNSLASKKLMKQKQYGKKRNNASKRQRQIASFSQSKPFKFKYILISLLVVCPFMIYPIFNLVNVNLFVDESLTTLTQRQAILSCSSFILNFEVVHFKIWEIVFSQPIFNKVFFYLYGKNVTEQAQGVMDGIKNLTNYETSSRYDFSQRQVYFSSLLLNSACDYIDQINSNKIASPYLQTNFTGAQCHTLLSGNLDRGFILAIQDLTNLYQDWFSTYEQFSAIQTSNQTYQHDITQYIINIQHTKNNLIDIYNSNILLQQLIASFEDFFENQNDKYTKYIIQMFTILMVLQMILIFLAISIVWTSLYQKFKKEISKTKLLLTNLHIDLILENKLTLLHFKNQSN